MKDVQLDCGHCVQISLKHFNRFEVPPYINKQTTPGKARLILNGYCGKVIATPITLQQLQQSLESAKSTNDSRSGKRSLLVSDIKAIAFVFIDGGNHEAACIA